MFTCYALQATRLFVTPTPRLLPTGIIDTLYTTDSMTGGSGRQQDLDRRMRLFPPRVSKDTEATLRVTFTMPKTFTAMPMAAKTLAYHTQHSAGFEQ
jgi:hypothetical protein